MRGKANKLGQKRGLGRAHGEMLRDLDAPLRCRLCGERFPSQILKAHHQCPAVKERWWLP